LTRYIAEALVVVGKPNSPIATKTTTTSAADTVDATAASETNHCSSRRSFLLGMVCGSNGAILGLRKAPSVAAAAAEPLCKPTEKLSDARAQIDMAVQASSVQAFSSAAELANDPLLDASSLEALVGESCRSAGGDDVVSEILRSVDSLRSTLNRPTALTTEDVKDVMRYGTTARSGIDSLLAL
jgi:hypothetical protein